METIIAIAILGIVGYSVYKMLSKKEPVQEAVVEPVAEVVAKVEEVVKAPEPVVVVNVEPIPAPVAEVPSLTVQHGEHAEEPVKVQELKVRAKRTKKVAPVVATIIKEPVVAPEPAKKVRKKKVK